MSNEVGTLNCLEVDTSQKVLFVGGSVAEGGRTKVPIICAFTLDSTFKLIELQKITDDPRMIAITSLRRHPSQDILFAGTFDGIMIMQWLHSSFFFISLITTNSPTPVIDICFHRGKLYAVSEFKNALLVSFGDEPAKRLTVRKTIDLMVNEEHPVSKRTTQSSKYTSNHGIVYHPERVSSTTGIGQIPMKDLSYPHQATVQSLGQNIDPKTASMQRFGSFDSNKGRDDSIKGRDDSIKGRDTINSFNNPPPEQNSTQYTRVTVDQTNNKLQDTVNRRLSTSLNRSNNEVKINIIDPTPPVTPSVNEGSMVISKQSRPPTELTESLLTKNLSGSKLAIPIKDQNSGTIW